MHRGQAKPIQIEFIIELQNSYRSQNRDDKLGDLLIAHRVVTPLALTEALAVQEEMPRESITKILEAMEEFPSKLTHVISD
ncbi:MAG: hypothetical protein JWQ35_97 [Bacteriovoracaceae bacterium]|nr:hypothetical protein [Bacteriovoracaceae bacterium]